MRAHFDEAFYLECYPEVCECGVPPFEHFASIGWKEGKDPAPWFSVTGYLERYADVRSSGSNPFNHYLLYGRAEGRVPWPQDGTPKHRVREDSWVALIRPEFDSEYYLEQYPEMRTAGIDPLQHYLERGWLEGCNPNSRFDTATYLEQNPSVRAANINPFVHFMQQIEPMRPHFDGAFYLESYPEVRELSMAPLEHFALLGWKEGKDPAPWFSVVGYLERYVDVRSSGSNPFVHYLLYGRAEGRVPWPRDDSRNAPTHGEDQIELTRSEFDANYYLETYPEVRSSGADPLQHYLARGWLEGCNPNSRFDTAKYLEQNPAVRAANINPFVHFIQQMETMRPHFDSTFYLERYPEIRGLVMTPLEHFAFTGWKEGKDPAPWFSVVGYLERNVDVRSSGSNPFIHYLLYGEAEGRNPRPQDGSQTRPAPQAFSNDQVELMRSEFDPDHYLEQYPDVRIGGSDPYQHYLQSGWLEGRDPNPRFDAAAYLERFPDVRLANINPFLHYLEHGRAEGRSPLPDRFRERPVSFSHLLTAPKISAARDRFDASIVVPIYNAYDDLCDLLASLQDAITSTTPVILVDDCSTDERIAPLLAEATARHDTWISVRNDRNIGFAASVNRGLDLAVGHVVVVNTDVLLPQGWLPRLMEPILANPRSIASVTPFSNHSHLTGFPDKRQEDDLYLGADLDEIDGAFRLLPPLDIDVASGVGFCIALNRRVLDAIGGFEAEIYQRGYFEDTDWCQLAVLAGYRNVAAMNLFVYHKIGSSSYGMKLRKQHSDRNRAKFIDRFPAFPDAEQYFLERDPLHEVRAVARALLWRRRASGSVLILDHTWGGGANRFSERLVQGYIAQNNLVIRLALYHSQVTWSLCFGDETIVVSDTDRGDVWNAVDRFDVTDIIVNGLHGASDAQGTAERLVQLDARVIVYAHDYMSVCPSIFLLNYKDQYCGVPTPFECQSCIFVNRNAKFPFTNIVEWRRSWGCLLDKASEIRVFSESSRSILLKAYPALGARIVITDPGYSPPVRPVAYQPSPLLTGGDGSPSSRPDRPLQVGIMGVLNLHKGTRVISGLANYVHQRELAAKLVLFGEWYGEVKPRNLDVLGPYKVEQISDDIEEAGIDVMLFPSVCPETYSYTLSEIFAMELPVVALSIGAQRERVREYPLGVLVDDPSPAALYAALEKAQALRCGQMNGGDCVNP